jgi:hypothetical protein
MSCFSCGADAERAVEVTFAGHHLGDGFVCNGCAPERALTELRAKHKALLDGGMSIDAVIAMMRMHVEGRMCQA